MQIHKHNPVLHMGKPITGPARANHRNGKPKYQGAWMNGYRSGQWRYWDTSGRLIREEYYNPRGLLDGVFIERNSYGMPVVNLKVVDGRIVTTNVAALADAQRNSALAAVRLQAALTLATLGQENEVALPVLQEAATISPVARAALNSVKEVQRTSAKKPRLNIKVAAAEKPDMTEFNDALTNLAAYAGDKQLVVQFSAKEVSVPSARRMLICVYDKDNNLLHRLRTDERFTLSPETYAAEGKKPKLLSPLRTSLTFNNIPNLDDAVAVECGFVED
jgi:hypothetical protein